MAHKHKKLTFEEEKEIIKLYREFEDYKHGLWKQRIAIEMAERKKLEMLKHRLKEELMNKQYRR